MFAWRSSTGWESAQKMHKLTGIKMKNPYPRQGAQEEQEVDADDECDEDEATPQDAPQAPPEPLLPVDHEFDVDEAPNDAVWKRAGILIWNAQQVSKFELYVDCD